MHGHDVLGQLVHLSHMPLQTCIPVWVGCTIHSACSRVGRHTLIVQVLPENVFGALHGDGYLQTDCQLRWSKPTASQCTNSCHRHCILVVGFLISLQPSIWGSRMRWHTCRLTQFAYPYPKSPLVAKVHACMAVEPTATHVLLCSSILQHAKDA